MRVIRERARIGGGRRAAPDGVAEGQDRARLWRPPASCSGSSSSSRPRKGEHFVRRWWRFRRIHNQFGWKFWAFISGGAALDAETEEFWRRLSFVVIQGYGLTETTSLISLNHPFRTGKRSIGKVLEGREMKLDENGEILVRGANVAAGYWQGKELKPVLERRRLVSHRRSRRTRCRGQPLFQGPQEERHRHPRGDEHLSRRPRSRAAPSARGARLRGRCAGAGRQCRALRGAAAARLGRSRRSSVQRANQQLAEFQRMRRWLVWPDQDFPRTPTQKPKTDVIQQAVQHRSSRRQPERCRARSAGRADQPNHRTQRRSAHGRCEAGRRPQPQLDGPGRADERAGRSATRSTWAKRTSRNVTTVGELERLLQQPQQAARSGYRYPRWALRWPITWIRTAVYYLLSLPATLIMAHPHIVGRENLDGLDGPGPGHVQSRDLHRRGIRADCAAAAIASQAGGRHARRTLWGMWRPPRSMNLFARWWQQAGYYLVVALFNVFPLPQQSGVRESFAYAGESVDRGYSVLVFPEGRRTPDGKPSPFRSGVGHAGVAAGCSGRADAHRRPVRHEDWPAARSPARRTARGHRQADALPAEHSAGRDHQSDRGCHVEDVSAGGRLHKIADPSSDLRLRSG